MHENIKRDIVSLRNDEAGNLRTRYFKHLEPHDVFLGVDNPSVHKIVAKYYNVSSLNDIEVLLADPYHECRYAALLLLVKKYEKAKDPFLKKEIVDLYLSNLHRVNNWDLVDCSSYKILGHYSYHFKDHEILLKLSENSNIWVLRVSIVSLLYFIKSKSFNLAQRILEPCLNHPHAMIYKAVGWMLKEMWQRGDEIAVEELIRDNLQIINRTTLRYAIEKMPDAQRKSFLAKT